MPAPPKALDWAQFSRSDQIGRRPRAGQASPAGGPDGPEKHFWTGPPQEEVKRASTGSLSNSGMHPRNLTPTLLTTSEHRKSRLAARTAREECLHCGSHRRASLGRKCGMMAAGTAPEIFGPRQSARFSPIRSRLGGDSGQSSYFGGKGYAFWISLSPYHISFSNVFDMIIH